MKARPEEFINSGELDIIIDYDTLLKYCEDNNRALGVVYESKYHFLVVDLVKDKNDKVFAYERILNTNAGGSVILTMHNGNYVLLKQYRHALRKFQYAFPRGFAELNITGEKNARKEASEELNSQTDNYTFLGKVVADSGLEGNYVDVYKCDIVDEVLASNTEGITGAIEVSECELKNMIQNNEITDGFTLSALALYKNM
jgi:ADP-ribose pyrophosphatase